MTNLIVYLFSAIGGLMIFVGGAKASAVYEQTGSVDFLNGSIIATGFIVLGIGLYIRYKDYKRKDLI